MCNCQETPGFNEKLKIAKQLTEQTGETHIVYVRKAVGHAYIRKESDIANAVGICCYFLPDGTEVEINTDANNIEVSNTEVITPKRAKRYANKSIQKEEPTTTDTTETNEGADASEPLS